MTAVNNRLKKESMESDAQDMLLRAVKGVVCFIESAVEETDDDEEEEDCVDLSREPKESAAKESASLPETTPASSGLVENPKESKPESMEPKSGDMPHASVPLPPAPAPVALEPEKAAAPPEKGVTVASSIAEATSSTRESFLTAEGCWGSRACF